MRPSSKSGTPFSLWLAVIASTNQAPKSLRFLILELGLVLLTAAATWAQTQVQQPDQVERININTTAGAPDVNSIQRDTATIFSAGAALALFQSYPDPQFRDYFKKCDDAQLRKDTQYGTRQCAERRFTVFFTY